MYPQIAAGLLYNHNLPLEMIVITDMNGIVYTMDADGKGETLDLDTGDWLLVRLPRSGRPYARHLILKPNPPSLAGATPTSGRLSVAVARKETK